MAKNTSPLENEEQESFFAYVALLYGRFPLLEKLCFSTQSGAWLHGTASQRSAQIQAAKRRGRKNGVADILCLIPMGEYHGLAIELKRKKGGKVSQDQSGWLDAASDAGYFATVCNGADEAIDVFNWYFGIRYDKN